MLPATNGNYWLAMLTAGTLGTASGDFTADVAGLGLFYGSAVLTALFAVVLIISWRFGGMSKPWYWASTVAARTAGTTLGDLLASRHGFDLGLPLSATLTASTLAIIVLFWPHPSSVVPIAKGRRGSFSGNGCFASPALRRLDEIRTNHGY
jgi:uncharacterized membrane-anchored protein